MGALLFHCVFTALRGWFALGHILWVVFSDVEKGLVGISTDCECINVAGADENQELHCSWSLCREW